MRPFVLTVQAEADIWDYIASDNMEAADRVRECFYEAIHLLAERPLIGHVREDLTSKPVRFWPAGKYLMVYRPTDQIQVVRVLHGSRDVRAALK